MDNIFSSCLFISSWFEFSNRERQNTNYIAYICVGGNINNLKEKYSKMDKFQLAQINVARIKGADINDPIMKEFVDSLDRVNELAEKSKGFVWRLKDENNNATNINPYNDEQIIVNLSVWETIEDLETFVYRTFHTDFLRRRKEWFQAYGKAHTAMWWIAAGQYPTVKEATDKLSYLQDNGSSDIAFDFKKKFPHP